MDDGGRFERAVAAIDAANAEDPNTIAVDGEERPKELTHAEMVTGWVRQLVDEPSEELLLAARAHHIRRWSIPRSTYPDGRSGYLRWRRTLHEQHADDVGRILDEVGYAAEAIERVRALVRKRDLRRGDPEAQALEDALCLVFIETQFHDVAERLDDERMVGVVVKTLAKMSAHGREHALGVRLRPDDEAVVRRAVERMEEETA